MKVSAIMYPLHQAYGRRFVAANYVITARDIILFQCFNKINKEAYTVTTNLNLVVIVMY